MRGWRVAQQGGDSLVSSTLPGYNNLSLSLSLSALPVAGDVPGETTAPEGAEVAASARFALGMGIGVA